LRTLLAHARPSPVPPQAEAAKHQAAVARELAAQREAKAKAAHERELAQIKRAEVGPAVASAAALPWARLRVPQSAAACQQHWLCNARSFPAYSLLHTLPAALPSRRPSRRPARRTPRSRLRAGRPTPRHARRRRSWRSLSRRLHACGARCRHLRSRGTPRSRSCCQRLRPCGSSWRRSERPPCYFRKISLEIYFEPQYAAGHPHAPNTPRRFPGPRRVLRSALHPRLWSLRLRCYGLKCTVSSLVSCFGYPCGTAPVLGQLGVGQELQASLGMASREEERWRLAPPVLAARGWRSTAPFADR
jgi:hypothetical protein